MQASGLSKSPMFLQPRYFEVNYNIFSLVILYEKLDRESRIFLSNKLSKLDFKFFEQLTQLVEYFAYNEKVGGSSPSLFIFNANIY